MSDMTFITALFFAAALVFLVSSLIFHAEVDRLREENAALREDNLNMTWATITRETPAEVPPVTPTETPIADRLASQRLLRNLNTYAANPFDSHLGEQP